MFISEMRELVGGQARNIPTQAFLEEAAFLEKQEDFQGPLRNEA